MPLRLKPLLSQLTIKTKKLETKRFDIDYVDPVEGDLGWAQRPFVAEVERQYNTGKPVRIITLKARQLGISTVTEAILFLWGFIHEGTNGLVIAHETVPSQELFEMTKLYWETWPYKSLYTLKYATKQHLHWLETRSKIRIATAKNISSGRGSTLHGVHASEVAFYPDPATLMLGLNQTIPHRHGTIVVLESTANGVGNWFYDQWMEAEDGGSDYVPMFFPWYKHPEYRVPTALTVRSELDSDERQLIRVGATLENIAWRRWAIINKAGGDLGMFMQEYPSTPEEAFITSGRPIFSQLHLKKTYNPKRGITGFLMTDSNSRNGVRFIEDPSGNLTLFKKPRIESRTDRYFVSGDPSETIVGDPACIQVINRQTFEQVAVWHGRINPLSFADEMEKIGYYFNTAMLCPEIEGGGQATIARLITKNYPSLWQHRQADRLPGKLSLTFGWATNFQRKSWCIGDLQRLIVDLSISIHDRKTYTQLRNYVQRDDGTWGNADAQTHDDAVMALAIGVAASIAEGPFMADAISHPIADIFNQEYGVNGVGGDGQVFGEVG